MKKTIWIALVLVAVAGIEALVRFLQARALLYRMDGSILDRRGIDVPSQHEYTE